MAKNILQGNEAVAEAALAAGMGFFAGYPITPASEVMVHLMKKKANAVQFEDEIASVNAIIGASMAGAKAMTATSGPGFSLMQEGIGLAAMTRTPIVIVDVMRVGPSTGMPTLPAQGDILQSRHGSHGDYFPIVFYPNSVSEIYKVTIDAFNAAEEMQGPVIMLLDGYLAHLYETFDMPKFGIAERKRPGLGQVGGRHFTGLVAEDGIPKTQDPETHKRIIAEMKKAQEETAARYELYEYVDKGSDTLVVAFGAVSRALSGLDYSMFRPIRMFPVVKKLAEIAGKYKNIAVVEMNTGQYSRVVERVLRREVHTIPLLGGKISTEEIRNGLSRIH